MRRIAASRERRVEVEGRGGGERVDRRGMAAHRGGEDAGHHEPRHALGEPSGDEGRIQGVGAHAGLIGPGQPQARADEQEQRELQDDADPGPDQRPLRVAQAPRGQQSLHDQVIGAVRRTREQRASQETTPERVHHGEGGPKIERHELPLVPGPEEFASAPGQVGGHDERGDPAYEIHPELDHVHPHDGPQAPDPRVDHRDEADREDAGGETPVGDEGNDDRRGKDAHAVGQGPGEEEDARGGTPGERPEATLQALVGRVLGALEISRQEQPRDADASDEVAEGELQEREIAARGEAWDRDHRQRRRLRRDDREHDGPPR